MYGEVRFVLRPAARDRTTMTVGDSLWGYSSPVHLTGPPVGPREAWDSVSRNAFGMHGIVAHENPARFQQRGYFEAQVHGGVQTSDIARMHLMGGPEDWTSDSRGLLRARATAAGIHVTYDEDVQQAADGPDWGLLARMRGES